MHLLHPLHPLPPLQAQEVLADFRAAGLRPSEQTLNVLLHGLLVPRREGSLAGAFDVFTEFSSGGGPVGLITYNIMIDGFAQEGQLVNAESLVAQLKRQGHRPDDFTFSSLLRAAAVAFEPRRALTYYRMMRNEGVPPSSGTLSLLAEALAADGSGVDAVRIARQEVSDVGLELDRGCCCALLRGCAKAGAAHKVQARESALWLWAYMGREGSGYDPLRDSRATRDLLRCLGAAEDFEQAREIFERAPRPRSPKVWQEMIKVCNACQKPEYALRIISQGGQVEGGGD